MTNQQTCSYCQRIWLKGEPFCVGCGAPESEVKHSEDVHEFYRDGYFVKSIRKGFSNQVMEYYFFRRDKLVERFEVSFRQYMKLREAYGLVDGEEGWEIIWDIFKEAQDRLSILFGRSLVDGVQKD